MYIYIVFDIIEKPVRHVVYQHDIVCMYKILSLILWDIIMNEQLINIIWTNIWASVFSGSQINGSRGFAIFKTVQHISSIFAYHKNISMCMCLSGLYLWYTATYKYISTSQARLLFTPTLQPWITNAVMIDVFITIPTRRKSVIKAWKYYAHTANHSVSHSPAPV